MFLTKLDIKNFRNYTDEHIDFDKFVNILYGANASGKTNLLEAIYICSLGKSFRSIKDKEIIKWQEKYSLIKLEVSTKYRKHTIELYLSEFGEKKILVDKIPIRQLSQLIGILNIVYFSPDELKLIKNSPAERRKFMDISLSQQKSLYFASLVKYNHILAQRNKFLKSKEILTNKEMIYIWNIQLINEGIKVFKHRHEFIQTIQPFAQAHNLKLSNNTENLVIDYESDIKFGTQQEMTAHYEKMLNDSLERDIYLGYTQIGVHRDDIDIKINDISVRKYGSQGQQRTVALSLKLSEINAIEQSTGEKPILLLDDVFSELDENRRNALVENFNTLQTIITCTEYDGSYKSFCVNNGTITK